jgi:hypothetical protein
MDFGIKELGITFMVGAFTILGFELIFYCFFNKELTGFFSGRLGLQDESVASDDQHTTKTPNKADADDKKETMRIAVFVGLAFAVGILAEDASYSYVESMNIPFRRIPAAVLSRFSPTQVHFDTSYDSRLRTIITDADAGAPAPQWLAMDLARTNSFVLTDPENGPKVTEWIKAPNTCKIGDGVCPSWQQLNESVQRLYFFAKNTVYSHPEYYDEMRRIQSRQEFSRALALISLLYFIIALVMLVPLAGLWLLRLRTGLSLRASYKLYLKVPFVFVTLFLVFMFSMYAYERESDAFNRRAFGYFSSIRLAEQARDNTKQPEK